MGPSQMQDGTIWTEVELNGTTTLPPHQKDGNKLFLDYDSI